MSKIMIDSGHAEATGAEGLDGIKEGRLNIDIAEKLSCLLEEKGNQVIRCNFKDDMSIKEVIDLSDICKPSIFIAIHQNWSGNPQARGFDTFYAMGNMKSKKLAEYVHVSMIEKLKLFEMYPHSILPLTDDQTAHKRIAVLRDIGCASILIECGFISNILDLHWLEYAMNQSRLVHAVQHGIEAWNI